MNPVFQLSFMKSVLNVQEIARYVTVANLTGSRVLRTYRHCADGCIPLDSVKPSSKTNINDQEDLNVGLQRSQVAAPSFESGDAEFCPTDRASISVVPKDKNTCPTMNPSTLVPSSASYSGQGAGLDTTPHVNGTKAKRVSSQKQGGPHGAAPVKQPSDSVPEGASESKLEQLCVSLGYSLGYCSGQYFTELQQIMQLQRDVFDLDNLPQELLCKDSITLKTKLSKGLQGQRNWCSEDKVAVAQLLLTYNSEFLFGQIGMLSQVSPHSCNSLDRNVGCLHVHLSQTNVREATSANQVPAFY